MMMRVISVRENPEYMDKAISYFQMRWASPDSMMVYDDCIRHCVTAEGPLPQWYLLLDGDFVVGCAGLITNDFISRMDLYPWICALYIEEEYRGQALGATLLEKACEDTSAAGFQKVYLCSDHVGYYEHYGFRRMGVGYHPWGDTSGIFVKELNR